MRPPILTLAASIAAPLVLITGTAAAQHLLIPDRLADRVCLFDASTGDLVDANYIDPGLGGMFTVNEAIQVGDQIWASDSGQRGIARFTLDGRTHLGTITNTPPAPIDRPAGIASDGDSVWLTCSFIASHGVSGNWVTRFAASGAGLGFFDIHNDEEASDAFAKDGVFWVANDDSKAIELYTPEGSFISVFASFGPDADFVPINQIAPTADGGVLAATSRGLWRFDADGQLVERLHPERIFRGVAQLADGRAIVTSQGVHTVEEDGSLTLIADLPAAGMISTISGATPCAADLAAPAGTLDLADVQGFITAFVAGDPLADLASPTDVYDLADLAAFVGSFTQGCD